MESVVSKLQETGQHVAKKSDLLFSRTREAGEAFLGEVRNAGREIVVLVRSEAKGWRRFLTQRTSRLQLEAKSVLTPKTFERELLSRVGGTLRSLDAKVVERLGALDKRATKPATKAARRKPATKRRGAPATKTNASGASLLAGGARH